MTKFYECMKKNVVQRFLDGLRLENEIENLLPPLICKWFSFCSLFFLDLYHFRFECSWVFVLHFCFYIFIDFSNEREKNKTNARIHGLKLKGLIIRVVGVFFGGIRSNVNVLCKLWFAVCVYLYACLFVCVCVCKQGLIENRFTKLCALFGAYNRRLLSSKVHSK